jgi:hypothetical protein
MESRPMFFRPRETDVRGQALAELAIILPVLLLLVFGMIDFGRGFRTHQVVTNAAREGARVAILWEATDQGVSDVILSRLQGAGLDPGEAAITLRCEGAMGLCTGSGRRGRRSEVEVRYPHRFTYLAGLAHLAGGIGAVGEISLRAHLTVRNE